MNDFVSLKSLCHKITDGSHFSPKAENTGFPMLSVKDMTDFGFSYVDCKFISELDYQKLVKSDCKPKLNDLLIAKDGSYLKHVFVIKEEIEQAVLSSIGILRPNLDKVIPDYLKYYLQTKSVKETVSKKYVSGSALPRIILKGFEQIAILLNDLPTQKSIAKVLSNLDTKIELNNRINRELEAMAKTLYDYWFVQFDFPNKQGKPYKSSGGKMVYNAYLKRDIPEGWKAGNLEDLGTIIGGSTPSKENSDYFTVGCSTPWITPKDLSLHKGNKFITRGEIDVTSSGIKNASLKLMPKGTVLLSSRAPVGYLAISRNIVTTNQGFKSFVPDKGFSTYFIFYTVQKMIPTIINNAVGSTFKEISGTTLKSIRVPIPVKSKIEVFDEKMSSIFKRQDFLELESQHLSGLRDWLLPMLMNGQVTVKEAEERLSMAAEPIVFAAADGI